MEQLTGRLLGAIARKFARTSMPSLKARCRSSITRVWATADSDRQVAYAAGTGRAVTDLIFSIAKREVTFFSGTALISFL